MAATEKKVDESGNIQFFGEIDLNRDGKIVSDMPAWYFDMHIEDLEENISRKERMLESGKMVGENVPLIRGQIKQEREKLKKILDSKPSLNDKQRDRCWKAYEKLQQQIKDTMPTRKETKNGLVNPRDELKRLKDVKHITIDPTIASACGVKADHGKITGDQANKCYKILGKVLGENTNVERLRKDGGGDAYKTINDLTKAILDGREVGRE